MPGFDLKQVSRNDKGIVGAGIVAFIASFLPYVGISGNVLGVHYDAHIDAWDGYAIFGLILVFAAAVVVALRVLGATRLPVLPVGPNLLVAALAAIGTLLVFLHGVAYGHGTSVEWGGWILIVAGVVETAFAVLNFRASGEEIAWDAAAMNRPSAASTGVYPPATGAYAPATGTYSPAPSAAVPPPAAPVADQPVYPPTDAGSPSA